MIKIIIAAFIAALAFSVIVIYAVLVPNRQDLINPLVKEVEEKVFPLNKYSFESLSKTDFLEDEIEIGEKIEEEDEEFDMYMFYFYDQDPSNLENRRKVSGLLTVPTQEGEYSVIIQFRGYVDREIYSTGVGTMRSAQEFAKAGFISLSPDFLGYGESENPSEQPIEERFQTYTTALSLIHSVQNLNNSLEEKDLEIFSNKKTVIWGHSNGGHIALALLSITGNNYPTVLWAPVTKPFPYSILYFTDEFEDEGKALRKVVSNFEKDYDVFKFSPNRYYDRINSSIQIHQGTLDDAVPVEWSDEFVEKLDELEIENDYHVYPGADHNLLGSWDEAVARSIDFYRTKLAE